MQFSMFLSCDTYKLIEQLVRTDKLDDNKLNYCTLPLMKELLPPSCRKAVFGVSSPAGNASEKFETIVIVLHVHASLANQQ
jgi:hypothetical protein